MRIGDLGVRLIESPHLLVDGWRDERHRGRVHGSVRTRSGRLRRVAYGRPVIGRYHVPCRVPDPSVYEVTTPPLGLWVAADHYYLAHPETARALRARLARLEAR